MKDMNEWFLSLPAGRQNTLNQDKWMLARAAYEAGRADIPPELDVTKFLLEIVPGWDGMGLEVYAKNIGEIEVRMSKMAEKLENWQLGIKRLPAVGVTDEQIDAAWHKHLNAGGARTDTYTGVRAFARAVLAFCASKPVGQNG